MGLPLQQCALHWHILLGHVLIRLLCELLPTILSVLGRVFPASRRTPHFGIHFHCSCGWLLCGSAHTAMGTHHRTSRRWHLRGLLAGLCLLFLLRLVPASASCCITGGACCIVADLLRAHRLLFQSLAMFEVIGHLLPRHGHFVQLLPAAVCHIIVATDYVVHVHLVIATSVHAEGPEG